jgi:putative ABC transport system permease protein
MAAGFTGGLVLAFGVLTGLGYLLMFLVRRFFPVSWSYVWRPEPGQPLPAAEPDADPGDFHRPGHVPHFHDVPHPKSLIRQVALTGSGNQPNMVLFDIQTEQKAGVRQLVDRYKLPVLQDVPVVTMRLAEINGRTVEALQKDTTDKLPDWALSASTASRTVIR